MAMDYVAAIKTLYQLTPRLTLVISVGAGAQDSVFRREEMLPRREDVLSQIERIEAESSQHGSHDLAFALGSALVAYVGRYARGSERRALLERVVRHWERAYHLAEGKKWEVLTHIKDEPQFLIACNLGSTLITEAVVRNLEEGIGYLEKVWNATTGYEPALCAYAEGLYKRGSYSDAVKVAVELDKRARNDLRWAACIPPAPMQIAAKAYRAEAKRLQKAGNRKEAVKVLQKLLATGMATPSDERLLERLRAEDA